MPKLQQREPWRHCEQILADTSLDAILMAHEPKEPLEVAIVRWHLARARERIANLNLQQRPSQVIHGDFTHWNVLFNNAQLSGILDFELAHLDHRVGDFALSWRGKYDAVIQGYNEVLPLEPEEWEMIAPVWWAYLIESACQLWRNDAQDDGWIIKKLLERSLFMGSDAKNLPPL